MRDFQKIFQRQIQCGRLIEFRTKRRIDIAKPIVAFEIFRTRLKGLLTLHELSTDKRQIVFKIYISTCLYTAHIYVREL